MTTRRASSLLVVLLLLAGAACGGGGDESGGDESSGDNSSETELNDAIESLPDEIDDLDDAIDAIDGIDDLVPGIADGCLEVSTTFGALGLAALGSSGSDAVEDSLAKLRDGDFPDELTDPFTVVADAYADLDLSDPAASSDAFDSQEYKDAEDEISTWLEENCNPGE